MTWQQFAGSLGAIALVAVWRLVNRWLPGGPDDPPLPRP